ncbi:MAG: hypothetical protein ACI95C_000043 [Pseudohongiellaceae bacterium]|jgi:hypothetical protein
MISTILNQYRATATVVAVLAVVLLLELFQVRSAIYPSLLPAFEWIKYSTPLGVIGTTYGSVYATVEAMHLISMATIGGVVLATDLRLLNVVLRDIPSEVIVAGTYKTFKVALLVAILTGIFCAAGVADKVYYMQVFWIKMLVLISGSAFMIFIKQPLLTSVPHSEINPWSIRLMAVTSLLIWVTVAATGRWIGFS